MRESFPARSGVLPFAVTRIPCPRGLLGRAKLDLARKHRPDLILMDIQLPEVSGLEVTKWLKEDAELKRRAFSVTAGLAVISLGSVRASHIKKGCGLLGPDASAKTLRGQKDWWPGPAAPSDRECA